MHTGSGEDLDPLYIEDVSRIPVTACQIFDDPTDNYWALQTLLTITFACLSVCVDIHTRGVPSFKRLY